MSRYPHALTEIGGLGFHGVGFVKIMASSELDVAKALDMAETVIAMMREELASSQDPVQLDETGMS